MKIMDWLRKLGIVRFGTKSYRYTSARDMPPEAFMDDVYDAEKDLLFSKDFNKKKEDEDMQKSDSEPKPQKKKGVKRWKKILGAVVVLIALLIGLVMWSTSGMTETADRFFGLIETGKYDSAYQMTSENFRRSVSRKQFESFIEESGLKDYKSSSWSSRSIESHIGKLEGAVTTKGGETIPIAMEFVKNGEEWKIYSITRRKAGLKEAEEPSMQAEKNRITEKNKPEIPKQAEIMELIQQSTLLFAKSVNAKSMSDFYRNISKAWQQQTSAEELDKAFAAFYKAGVDLTVLQSVKPVLDKAPELAEDNELVVQGHYPTTPSVVHFVYTYFPENGEWKLVGLNVSIK